MYATEPYAARAYAAIDAFGVYTPDGIDFAAMDNRPHCYATANRPHYQTPDNRPHYEVS